MSIGESSGEPAQQIYLFLFEKATNKKSAWGHVLYRDLNNLLKSKGF